MPTHSRSGIRWKNPRTQKLMRHKGIKSRYQLHQALPAPKATVYTMFNEDWTGEPTMRFVALVADRLGVEPGTLIEAIPPVKKTRPQRRAQTNEQP